MWNSFKIFPLNKLILLCVFFSSIVFSQTNKKNNFSGRFIITLDGGFTVGKSDYQESALGAIAEGSVEYFFPTISPSSLGLRLFGGGLTVKGKDDRRIVNEFSTDINMLGLGFIYSYSINNNVFPYLYAGISTNWFNPKTSEGRRAPNNSQNLYSKNTISYDIEFGLRIPVSNNWSIKVASGIHFFNSDLIDDISPEFELDFPAGPNNDFAATGIIGLSYSFSHTRDSDGDGVDDDIDMCPNTPRGVIIDEYGCPLDSDGDGVPDYLDKCPNTLAGEAVNEDGCPKDSDKDGVPDALDKCPDTPLGITVDENGCPSDLDHDGVPDYIDECPGTGAGVSVDSKGCPNDSDKDGVPDSIDICPDTPAGVQVDEFGCATTKVDTTSKTQTKVPEKDTTPVNKVPDININIPKDNSKTNTNLSQIPSGTSKIVLQSDDIFIPGTSTLNADANKKLDNIVEFLSKDPWTKWKIEGYVDSNAPEGQKASLSYEKANTIMNYFIDHGLPSFQFQVYGLGDESPVASNSTEEGRSKNRRIELKKIKK